MLTDSTKTVLTYKSVSDVKLVLHIFTPEGHAAIARAIADTGHDGFVGHVFFPVGDAMDG